MEILQDILDGTAPFPQLGDRITDSEWEDIAEYGIVDDAVYPTVHIVWDNGMISTEQVRY